MQPRHNPLTFYLRTLMYMVLALLMRLVALAPLACLFAFPSDSYWRYLALLCPVLMIFVVLPMRFSLAEALVQKPRQRYFSFDTALGMGLYGEKLGESLLHALNVLKWGIPFVLMLGGCYYCYTRIDIFTLLAQLGEIGKTVVGIWNSVANFFITLFGSINTLTYQGGLGEGIATVGAVLGLGLLLWMYGAARNSSTRYIWVLATRAERSPRTEIRRRLAGRRRMQLLVALLNLVLWAPFVWVVAVTFKDVITDLSGKLMLALTQKKLPAVDLASSVKPLAFAFLCLYFPLLPARRYTCAAFSTHDARHTAPVHPVADEHPIAFDDGGAQPQLFADLSGAAKPAPERAEEIKPAVFDSASQSVPETTPMAAEEPSEEWEYKPYDPKDAEPAAPVADEEPAYTYEAPAEYADAAQAEQAQPVADEEPSEAPADGQEPPANDPPAFTLGQ